MAKEKQIEEMAREMCHLSKECKTCQICNERYNGGDDDDDELCYFQCVAKEIINHSYRKQSDVAKEIFDEIERILSLNYCCCLPQGATEHYEYYEGNIAKDIAELKNKYIGEK